MTEDGAPIAYTGLQKGVPVVTTSGRELGKVEHVLQIPEEDVFDGIVVNTDKGLRFVDRDQVGQITTSRVTCELTDAQADSLPEPAAPPVYDTDALADSGESLHDIFGRMFRRGRWTQERE